MRDVLGLSTRIVGVVSEHANAYARSFAAGKVIKTDTAHTFADGLAVRVPDPMALAVIRSGADRIVEVSEAELVAAIGIYFSDTHTVAEGAGAAPLAALLKERDLMQGRRVGLVLSGQNIDRAVFGEVLGRALPYFGGHERGTTGDPAASTNAHNDGGAPQYPTTVP
jgi:threonine dehydratase